MRGSRAAALAAVAAGVLLASAYLCTSRVPKGSLGLRASGGGTAELLQPGLHIHSPFTRIRLLPAVERMFSGELKITTREGATLSAPYRLSLDFTKADPQQLTPLQEHLASEADLDRAILRLLQGIAAASPADATAHFGAQQEQQMAAKLVGLGLVPDSLEIGATRAASTVIDHPLLRSHVPPPWRVLVIGIDSADWDLMTPLMESGALPHLKALRDRGAWGVLRSMRPTLSPILWTTIATGRPPEEHGVIDFLMKDPSSGAEVPISRHFRRVKAVWNIATDFGIPSLTVGWWATWPAERVNGHMVTDRVAYSLFDLPFGEQQAGAVYPESLGQEVSGMKVHEEAVAYEELREILDVPQPDFERARAALGSPEGYRDPLCHMIKVLASTQTYHRIALTLLKRERPGLALVYFEGLDEANHRFAHYMPPRMKLTEATPPVLAAAYAHAVPNFYRLQDSLVGELVEAAGKNETVVMVLSDHGFANGSERPVDVPPDIEGQPGMWHTMEGALIVAGPPIRPGRLAGPVDLLDVTPTLLALMGLPPGADMPGRLATEALKPGPAPGPPPPPVASFDDIGEPLQSIDVAAVSPQDQEMIAKLTALGYIDGDGGEATSTGTATYHINAGHILLSKNELDRARDQFLRARELAPRFNQPLLGLAQAETMRGRPAEAIPYLEEALKITPDPQPVLLTRAAQVYARAARPAEGLALLESLSFQGRREAFRLTAIGTLREASGDPDGAATAYRAALEIDPAVERALQRVYALLKKKGELDELASLLGASTGVEPVTVSVRATNWLALTRELQGRRAEARSQLKKALEKSPDDVMTLINLGSMFSRDDMAAEALPYLERAYARQPRALEVLVNLIVAHGKASHLPQARRYFKEGEAVAQRPELYNAIAYACFLNEAIADADAYIRRSLAMDPSQDNARRLKEEIDRRHGG